MPFKYACSIFKIISRIFLNSFFPYPNSMIAKNFLFSFVNSYASFFFVAFFANIVQKPTYPGQPPDNNVGMCGYPGLCILC